MDALECLKEFLLYLGVLSTGQVGILVTERKGQGTEWLLGRMSE